MGDLKHKEAIEHLNEMVWDDGVGGTLREQEQVDAALARDLLELDQNEIPGWTLDEWPAARDFVVRITQRYVIRADLPPERSEP